jgi:hypothetical protein
MTLGTVDKKGQDTAIKKFLLGTSEQAICQDVIKPTGDCSGEDGSASLIP